MPTGGKDAFLSKVTFRRESNWVSKTKQILKDMKTIGERFDEMAETAGVSKTDKGYYFGRSCCFQIATEQKAIDNKMFDQFLCSLRSGNMWEGREWRFQRMWREFMENYKAMEE